MSWLPLVLLLSVIALPALPGPAAQRSLQTAPESFMANAQATGAGLVTFRVSEAGVGHLGSMAGAAKVKVGPSGIEVKDYGEKPVELRGITLGFK